MNNEIFDRLLVSLEGLLGKRRDVVADRVKVLSEHADTARLVTEKRGHPAACPHCADTRVVRFGFAAARQEAGRPVAR